MAEDLDEDLLRSDDDTELMDPLSFNIPSSTSKYITDNKLNKFFKFDDKSALNVMHVNCRSLKQNFGALTNLLNQLTSNISVIALTETWPSESLQDVYNIPGYNFISNHRIGKTGGGVGLFLNNQFEYRHRFDLCRMCDFIECVFIEIQRASLQPVFVGSIYRPPNTDISLFIAELQSILTIIDNTCKKIAIIAGDFNLNLLKHSSHTQTGDFLNILLSYNYMPTIGQPTRITELSATLIDNIFIHSEKLDYNSAIVYNDISDHLPIAIHLMCGVTKVKRQKSLTKRSFDAISI